MRSALFSRICVCCLAILAGFSIAGFAQTVTVSPTALPFASVMVNGSASKAVTLTNGQSTAITLSAPTFVGSGFSIVSGGSCGTTLAPAHSCTYHVSFNPTAPMAYSATLSINDTASNSPQQVALTGTGVYPVTLTFANTYFGNQVITTSSGPHTGTLTNNQTVAVSSIHATSTGEFAIVPGGTCGTTLAAHGKCTILVSFTPMGLGTRTGTLTATDNASNSPQTVTITGTGTIAGVRAMTIAPSNPKVTQGQNQQFTLTGTTSTGGTLNLTSVATWNSASNNVATINAAGLAHAVTPGVSSITATLSTLKSSTLMTVAPISNTNNACTGGPCVLTYHNDGSRDGVYGTEMVLNPTNVVKPGFGGKGKITDLNGTIFAQPLYLSGMYGMSSNGNVLYLATQKDYVYAFDADSLAQLWGGSYIPAGEVPLTTGAGGDFACTNITPNVGITSTPVIDISTKYNANPVMYFVTRSETTGSSKTYHQRLHAVDTVTGMEVFGSPVEITTPAGSPVPFDPLYENQRSGLALTHDANGNPQVYIAWASHCDMQPFRGWMMKYMVTSGGVLGTTPANYFVTTQGIGEEAGIWMSGSAPAVDNPVNGNLYLATGNGSYDGVVNWGQSVLKLDSNLNVLDWYTPNEWPCLNAIAGNPNCTSDRDLGSGGVVLFNVPGGSPELTSIGKQGEVYVLYQSNLGHLDPAPLDSQYAPPYTCTEGAPAGPDIAQCFLGIQTSNQHGTGLFSTPAMWNGMMFAAGASGTLVSYTLNPAQLGTFNETPVISNYPPNYPYPGAGVVVSWNGSDPSTGVLWALSTAGSNNSPPTADILRAYNPFTMTMTYQSSGGPGAVRFVMPIVVNGKVYVAGQGNSTTPGKGQVYVYGLCPCQQ